MKKNVFSGFYSCISVCSLLVLCSCAGTSSNEEIMFVETPSVDYVEGLDVYSATHNDSFLNQLAMNYRSYAVYNARTSGYPDVGELFAQKALVAFSGETPFPETLQNWELTDEQDVFELRNAYNAMIDAFKHDAIDEKPEIAAEIQAKFDCWLSALSTHQYETAQSCRERFTNALDVLNNCTSGSCHLNNKVDMFQINEEETVVAKRAKTNKRNSYYPETRSLKSFGAESRSKDGIVIVNNVNVPENLVTVVPVSGGDTDGKNPFVFNQNIYGGDKTLNANNGNVLATDNGNSASAGCSCNKGHKHHKRDNRNTDDEYELLVIEEDVENCECAPESEEIEIIADDFISRDEFVDIMMAMRAELQAINSRLDKMAANTKDDTTVIKVQQVPLEPRQHVMEEVFEVQFDFNKSSIKPEYKDLIKQLAQATQENKNIKVSVVGHTDTVGTKEYNYALGGKRAEAVQKMLIEYGIPASQIVAVSAGKEDLKVPTPDGVKNAENRRVRVVKETSYTEPAEFVPVATVEAENYKIVELGAGE